MSVMPDDDGHLELGSLPTPRAAMPGAVAEQIALIRAEIGLTGTGVLDELVADDFGGCDGVGDLGATVAAALRVRVHGSRCEGLLYRLVVGAATAYALFTVAQAVARTRQWRWETSFQVTREASIAIPKIDLCVTNYDTNAFVFENVTLYEGGAGADGWLPANRAGVSYRLGRDWAADGGTVTLARGPIGWHQAGDVAAPNRGGGGDVVATATFLAEARGNPESEGAVLTEELCIEAETPPTLDSVSTYFAVKVDWVLKCVAHSSASCFGGAEHAAANDDFDADTGDGWAKPLVLSFVRVHDGSGDAKKFYFDIDAYTMVALTKGTHEEVDKAGDATKSVTISTAVTQFQLAPGAAGHGQRWADGLFSASQSVYVHMATMSVAASRSERVRRGTPDEVWATIGGAAAAIAIAVAAFFVPINLESRDPSDAAPSRPYVVGRWRACSTKRIVRDAKRVALFAVKESLTGDA